MTLKSKASIRKSIRTAELIQRLQDHVDGKLELKATQVRAAEILLNKRLPNLLAAKASGEPGKVPVSFVIKHD